MPTPRLDAKFRRFHSQNPHVYSHLERLAFKLRNRGVQRWGVKALWEVLRYELALNTDEPVGAYKLNNSFTAYYARLLMERNPEDLADFFETRERQHPPESVDPKP